MKSNFLADITQTEPVPLEGIGPLGLEGGGGDAGPLFVETISKIVGVMTIIAAIWFIFLLMSGAFAYMGAGGDKAKIEGAQKRISNGIIGLVIAVAALFLTDLIGNIIGFESILDPVTTILSTP